MKKIELEIIHLQSTGTGVHYVMILQEKSGFRKMPIVIGESEAHSIAIVLNNVTPPRPLTHDLMINTLKAFGIEIKEVVITKIQNNIFYAELVCVHENTGVTVRIDSRTSDAIALAIRVNAKIYTYEDVLSELWDAFFDQTSKFEDEKQKILNEIKDLERRLKKAVKEERYEDASVLRDKIFQLKKRLNEL